MQSQCHLVGTYGLSFQDIVHYGANPGFCFKRICTYLETLLIPKATCWLRDEMILSLFSICRWFSCHRNVNVFNCFSKSCSKKNTFLLILLKLPEIERKKLGSLEKKISFSWTFELALTCLRSNGKSTYFTLMVQFIKLLLSSKLFLLNFFIFCQ